jgi:hypothetical protein
MDKIKMICIHCKVNKALTFMELITKCDEMGFHDDYMPIQDYCKDDSCFSCVKDDVSEYAQALYEYEHDL